MTQYTQTQSFTYGPETHEAIAANLEVIKEAVWNAEIVNVDLIYKDTQVPNMTKANEVIRAMGRYINIVNQLSNVTYVALPNTPQQYYQAPMYPFPYGHNYPYNPQPMQPMQPTILPNALIRYVDKLIMEIDNGESVVTIMDTTNERSIACPFEINVMVNDQAVLATTVIMSAIIDDQESRVIIGTAFTIDKDLSIDQPGVINALLSYVARKCDIPKNLLAGGLRKTTNGITCVYIDFAYPDIAQEVRDDFHDTVDSLTVDVYTFESIFQ